MGEMEDGSRDDDDDDVRMYVMMCFRKKNQRSLMAAVDVSI